MSETELKPCPFCDGKAHLYHGELNRYVAQCKTCGIRTQAYLKEESAVAIWNRRTSNERS